MVSTHAKRTPISAASCDLACEVGDEARRTVERLAPFRRLVQRKSSRPRRANGDGNHVDATQDRGCHRRSDGHLGQVRSAGLAQEEDLSADGGVRRGDNVVERPAGADVLVDFKHAGSRPGMLLAQLNAGAGLPGRAWTQNCSVATWGGRDTRPAFTQAAQTQAVCGPDSRHDAD